MINDKKIVLEGLYENVIQHNDHYYITSKKDRVCVLPYTISSDGLLDKIGIVEDWNSEEQKKLLTLLYDYLNTDDETNLVGANRVLFQTLGINFNKAEKWMFLGSVFNNLTSESPINIYSVDISDLEIDKITLETPTGKKFKLIDCSSVLQTDDILFLGAFSRLFNFFYVKSFKQNK
jgi:hypothetical protein